jgi:nucleotide-binding universal stress UspA family protein
MITIVYTTAGAEDTVGLGHALGLTRAARGRLVLLHAADADASPIVMPDPAPLLRGWGDEAGSVEVAEHVHRCCDEPTDTLLDALRRLTPDLVVATTHPRGALARIFAGSVAESIAANTRVPTLLLPDGTHGFVGIADGRIDVRRIIVPLGDPDAARVALRTATWFARLCGVTTTELVLLHVGAPHAEMHALDDCASGWTVTRRDVTDRSIEDAIVDASDEPCLVVMATRGHDSLGDVIRGSHTERVLHRVRCPVLSVAV